MTPGRRPTTLAAQLCGFVSKGSEKSNEFRRYRQALTAVYLATIGGGFALLAVSVAVELFMRPHVEVDGPVLSAENPDPAMLLECNQQVQKLYNDLGDETARLLDSPRRSDSADLGRSWERFGRDWVREWHRVDATCRFEDLAGSMGEPYDRMAQVHGDLRAMRLKYQSLLVHFDDEQADELREMRRALAQSRSALEKFQIESAAGGGQ